MSSLGQKWKSQVTLDQENYNELITDLQHREVEAQEWVQDIRTQGLAQGIESCIANGSDSLGLLVPSSILFTNAFQAFMAEQSHHDLQMNVALNAEDEETSILLVTPARS
ncbi:MAG: hypothetical protein DI585_05730 [Pseudomonas fluorescens]|nr:MAG: hypothetical protein DI585_05730 [Pseudomonas fluorescens]